MQDHRAKDQKGEGNEKPFRPVKLVLCGLMRLSRVGGVNCSSDLHAVTLRAGNAGVDGTGGLVCMKLLDKFSPIPFLRSALVRPSQMGDVRSLCKR